RVLIHSGGGDRTHDLSGMNRTLSPAELRRHKAPQAGFEPATDRLTADCSTTELLWNIGYNDALAFYFIKVDGSLGATPCVRASLASVLLLVCWLVVSKRFLPVSHGHWDIALPLSYCGILVIMMH